ncbi:hypothetical protein MTY59_44920 [Mycobacterium senriense]|uniref:Uncharacterized protein n=1 Tax=Mycobacterium senriense TaxID=2775496 RepID=A0ABN6IM70_9MYCO|nr:hypothetical protein MTY59_44920 [Mycobacterium senriense]
MLARHFADAPLQLGRPVDFDRGAALVGHQRVGPVGGQLHPLGHPGEGFFPVGQLGGDAAVAVVQIAELRALPQRVVDVLHRQRRPVGAASRGPAGIRNPQVAHQRGDGHAVGGDVVHHGHQHMLIVAEPEKLRPQRDLGRQVEGVAGRVADRLFQVAFRPAAGVDDLPAEIGLVRGDYHLLRGSLWGREQGAQALVAGHHVAQRRTECVGVEPAVQPQRGRHVVNR